MPNTKSFDDDTRATFNTLPNDTASGRYVSECTLPNENTSVRYISENTLPAENISGRYISESTLPDENTSVRYVSESTLLNENASDRYVSESLVSMSHDKGWVNISTEDNCFAPMAHKIYYTTSPSQVLPACDDPYQTSGNHSINIATNPQQSRNGFSNTSTHSTCIMVNSNQNQNSSFRLNNTQSSGNSGLPVYSNQSQSSSFRLTNVQSSAGAGLPAYNATINDSELGAMRATSRNRPIQPRVVEISPNDSNLVENDDSYAAGNVIYAPIQTNNLITTNNGMDDVAFQPGMIINASGNVISNSDGRGGRLLNHYVMVSQANNRKITPHTVGIANISNVSTTMQDSEAAKDFHHQLVNPNNVLSSKHV